MCKDNSLIIKQYHDHAQNKKKTLMYSNMIMIHRKCSIININNIKIIHFLKFNFQNKLYFNQFESNQF